MWLTPEEGTWTGPDSTWERVSGSDIELGGVRSGLILGLRGALFLGVAQGHRSSMDS